MKYVSSRLLAALLISIFSITPVIADLSNDLRKICGASKVRVVWTRFGIENGVFNNGCFPNIYPNSKSNIVRFDSETGVVDTIFSTQYQNYQKLLMTRNGDIIYTTITTVADPGAIYLVDWKNPVYPGTKLADGFGCCLVFDKKSGKEYLIYTKNGTLYGKEPVYKMDIANPTDNTVIFNENETITIRGHWLAVASDLKKMFFITSWGSAIPMYNLETQKMIYDIDYGCWPTMPYDTTGRGLCFNQDHTGWLCASANGETIKEYKPYKSKGNNLRFATYSKDLIFLTFDLSSNNVGGELHIYKLNEDFSNYLEDVQVTKGTSDASPDLWTPKSESDIFITSPFSADTFKVGDTVNIRWNFNEAYYDSANGAVIKMTLDNGQTWSDGLCSIEQPKFPAISKDKQYFGNANFIIPDSVVVDNQKVSTGLKSIRFMIEDYGNSSLKKAKTSSTFLIEAPVSINLKKHDIKSTFIEKSQIRYFDINGRLITGNINRGVNNKMISGVYISVEGNSCTQKIRKVVNTGK